MPRKKPSYELCYDAIEKDQDMLQCKEECGSTVYRYCAGVTKRQLEELSKGSLPFVSVMFLEDSELYNPRTTVRSESSNN